MANHLFCYQDESSKKATAFLTIESYRVNIPWAGSLEELVTSSYSLEYLPAALKWMDSAHYVQSPAYIAKSDSDIKKT